MSQLTTAITHQLQRRYQQPVFQASTGSWYTGADVLEDLTLCVTSLQQQNVHAGQTILISSTAAATIPALLLASWQLDLTVTLTPPSPCLPQLSLDAYAAMVYAPTQTQQLAAQHDPREISMLTLILNTAPNFAYLVHDHALPMTRRSRPDLILPASQQQLTQTQLLTLAEHATPQPQLSDLFDLKAGLIPCLTNLLTATPFTLTTTKNVCLPS